MKIISLKKLFFGHLVNYPTPVNINYFWGFGFASGLFLTIQIVTGVMLAMHYVPNIELAFESLDHISRNVNYGWFLRALHSNGASFFFICIYTHICKNIYYRSYRAPRQHVWASGVLIFFLSMATAFIGYVLPWGQMSFWGATVITNLITAVPVIGTDIVLWLWGGFSVGNATLNRFFSIHYLLPLLLVVLVILHLALLHDSGSNNPLGINSAQDKINFYPYFLIKDIFTFLIIIFFYFIFVFYYPDALGHSDNYIEANPLSTPAHIVPEWYFLPFYAILRSIPDKLLGVLAMFSSILILLFLPLLDRSIYFASPRFSFIFECTFWALFTNAVLLGWLGAMPVEEPYLTASRLCTFFYFFIFIFILFYSVVENWFIKRSVLRIV